MRQARMAPVLRYLATFAHQPATPTFGETPVIEAAVLAAWISAAPERASLRPNVARVLCDLERTYGRSCVDTHRQA